MRRTRNNLKLWTLMLGAIIFSTIGSGFAASEETYKGLKIFAEVIELIEENYVDEVDTKELIQKAIQGMVHSLDPHSQLMPPEAFEELQIDTKGEFGGIGIVITMQKKLLTVIAPIEGTPADKAGIKAGDIIIKVDGESTKEMMLWEAVKMMRGPKGESVLIEVVRKDAPEPIEFNLVRATIPINSIRQITLQSGYGYIRVTNFQENTADELLNALNEIRAEQNEIGLKGLILDLRDNPGGLLNQAVRVSDIFLEEGGIVSIKGRLPRHTKAFNSHIDKYGDDFPLVVLINEGSASASEIVAGAIQDHKRGLIMGTTSFGKGSVQTVEPLRDNYGLKFTIARYYTPNGRSIQAQGIIPDIKVKYKKLDLSKKIETSILKEKDLKNHLEEETPPEENKNPENKQEPELRNQNRYGSLKIEDMKTDNQVMRALEILISYQIFKE